MNFLNFNNNIFQYRLDGGSLFMDAKAVLKHVFASGSNYTNDAAKLSTASTEGGRTPVWVSFGEFETYFLSKANAARTTEGQNFDWTAFKDNLFDTLFDAGHTQFVSNRRKAENEQVAAKQTADEKAELVRLRTRVEQLETTERTRIANENEKAKAGVNWFIKFMNQPSFVVALYFVFGTVIGLFSHEILSTTLGVDPILSICLAVAWPLFPTLCAVRGYNFPLPFTTEKLNPLYVVLLVDIVFTAYHIGWLKTDTGHDYAEVAQANTSWVVEFCYVFIIPFMQKSMNDMILKLREGYLLKGWLPRIQ